MSRLNFHRAPPWSTSTTRGTTGDPIGGGSVLPIRNREQDTIVLKKQQIPSVLHQRIGPPTTSQEFDPHQSHLYQQHQEDLLRVCDDVDYDNGNRELLISPHHQQPSVNSQNAQQQQFLQRDSSSNERGRRTRRTRKNHLLQTGLLRLFILFTMFVQCDMTQAVLSPYIIKPKLIIRPRA